MWPKVNKNLLPMKGHYFLYNAGMAPIQPFMPVYAKYLGFSPAVVGVIYSILPVIGMLAKPLFGAIADQFRLHKFLFIFFQVITIIAFFSIKFVPRISDEDKRVNLVCGSQMNFHVDVANIRDTCMIERAIDAKNPEKIVACSAECVLTQAFQNEICNHWRSQASVCQNGTNVGHFRNVVNGNSNFSSKKLKAVDVGKDAYAEKFRSFSSGDSVQLLNASIDMRHTVQIGSIMYFRVASVQLKDDPSLHTPYCLQEIDTNCTLSCKNSRLADLLSNEESDENWNVVNSYKFWLMFCFLVLSWVGMAVVGSISDAICFELLGVKASHYGYQRLWGSVGWGLFTLFTGFIIDKFSEGKSEKNYTPIFYLMLIMLSCDIACMYSLKYQQTKLSTQIVKNVGKLLKNIRVLVFLAWCISVGICIGTQWNFLFWYVEVLGSSNNNCDSKAWIKTLQGLLGCIQCFLGELPSFFVSGWLLKKFGHVNVMSGILLFMGIRFLLYSYLTNPWWCLPIEIMQATVGLSFATMASYASIVAPPGAEATVQGLVGATFEGIGVSLGSFLGGQMFSKYGGDILFRTFGLGALVVFVLHAGVQYLLGRSTGFIVDGKDFSGVAKYASPNEAVSMLEDT